MEASISAVIFATVFQAKEKLDLLGYYNLISYNAISIQCD